MLGNQLLDESGLVLGQTNNLYAFYQKGDEDSVDCFIAPKQHHPSVTSLPPTWGQEFSELYEIVCEELGLEEHNGYFNEGCAAGQTIPGHLHIKLTPAPKWGAPSYGMGLALLRRKFDRVHKMHSQTLKDTTVH